MIKVKISRAVCPAMVEYLLWFEGGTKCDKNIDFNPLIGRPMGALYGDLFSNDMDGRLIASQSPVAFIKGQPSHTPLIAVLVDMSDKYLD